MGERAFMGSASDWPPREGSFTTCDKKATHRGIRAKATQLTQKALGEKSLSGDS